VPSYEYPGLVKILLHEGPEGDPNLRDFVDLSAYITKANAYVKDFLPKLDSTRPAIVENCLYTITPDRYPVMDRISAHITMGVGYSGSGFKHSPASGKILSAISRNEGHKLEPGFELQRWSLRRFDKILNAKL